MFVRENNTENQYFLFKFGDAANSKKKNKNKNLPYKIYNTYK